MQIVSLSSPYPLKAFQVAMIQPAYWPRVDLQELYRCAVWSGQGAPSIDFHLLPSNVMRVDQGAKWVFRFQRCRMADNIIILPLILIDIFLSLGNLFIEILVVVAAVADAFLMRSNSWLPRANILSFFFCCWIRSGGVESASAAMAERSLFWHTWWRRRLRGS